MTRSMVQLFEERKQGLLLAVQKHTSQEGFVWVQVERGVRVLYDYSLKGFVSMVYKKDGKEIEERLD